MQHQHRSYETKTMHRNLDAFEQFSQRRKRPPLADISNGRNVAKPLHRKPSASGIKISHLRRLTQQTTTQKNTGRDSIFDLRKVIGDNVKASHRENNRLAHKSASDTLAISKLKVSNGVKLRPAYMELSRSTEYNQVVAESNRAIEKVTSRSRINSADATETGKTSKGDTDGHCTSDTTADKVINVSQVGPFLLAVRVELGEVHLLMNGNNIALDVGCKIQLGPYQVYKIDGADTKVCSAWRLVK